MKKIYILMICFLLCGCKNNQEETDFIKKNESVENTIVEPEYVDDNEIKLSLYVDSESGGLDKVGDSIDSSWVKKTDITVLGALYTEDEHLRNDYFQYLWKENAEKYDNYLDYKIGWEVKFSLVTGEEYDLTILKPSDAESIYDYLELYLYDSVNVPINTWYSHMLDDQMDENTILTSLKLTAGSNYEQINNQIYVKAFTYDSDDFDENNQYRGNSYKSVVLNNK